MAKLTKAQRKAHEQAEAMLTKDKLADWERDFVIDNWHEGANHEIGRAGAHFTPDGLAHDFALEVGGGYVIDLCAGIGGLAYAVTNRCSLRCAINLVCVEANPAYVEIGKKIVPHAKWICADVMDWRTWWRDELDCREFDYAISNPPFGRVKRTADGPRYRGADFEFHVMDIASEMARNGVFIVPQMSAPFTYSGSQLYTPRTTGKAVDYERLTGISLEIGVGIDTAFYADQWKSTNITTEVVTADFAEAKKRQRTAEAAAAVQPVYTEQMAFL